MVKETTPSKLFGDTILVEDLEDPDGPMLVKEIIEPETEKIKSYVFIENWYLDTKTLQIEKEVVGIAPVRYYINTDNPTAQPVRKIDFVVYFDESKKF